MAEIIVRFDLRFSRRSMRVLMAGAMILGITPELASENVTLSTYYPAPSGVYTKLVTTDQTILARDPSATSAVGVGTPTPGSLANSKFTIDPTQGGFSTALTIQQGGQRVLALNPQGTGGWVMYDGSNNSWNAGIFQGGTATTAGKVGIAGAPTAGYALGVNGSETVNGGNLNFSGGAVVGNYGLQPNYVNWAAYGTGAGGAAVYNDGSTYMNLMLVGNNAGTGGNRNVVVYDNLNVAASLWSPGSYVNSNASCYQPNICKDNIGQWRSFCAGTQVICPAGWFVTLTSGIDTKYTYMNNGVDPYGDALCCPCTAGIQGSSNIVGGGKLAYGNSCPSF